MAKKDEYGFLATVLAYPIVMADLAVEKVASSFDKEEKRKQIKKASTINGREIDPETECGVLEVRSEQAAINAIEVLTPVIRITGPAAKSMIANVDSRKNKTIASKIGIGFGVTAAIVSLPIGVAIAAGSFFGGLRNTTKNINKYESVIE